jgi:NADH-quinone oxidoreductase subunit G
MLKQDGKWIETDWQTALEYVAHGLRNIRHEHGADAIAALAAPNSTLEELGLLQKVVRGLGCDNVDFRLRQSDFALSGQVTPWLGMSINEFAQLKRAFIIGSSLRKEHPLLAARLRQAVKRGGSISLLHAVDDDLLMPVANKIIAAPSAWLAALGDVIAAVALAKGVAAPAGFEGIEPSPQAKLTAAGLLSGEPRAVLLGNAAAHHPEASQLHAATQWIAEATGAAFGYLTESANTVGGHIAGALPRNGGNAGQLLSQPRRAYLVLHAEPELDCHDPQLARCALEQAEMVVVMSAYKHGMDYADVLLPVAPWSETAGTYINCEGRVQGFNGSAKPLGDTRTAWKVLRVLGNLLDLPGFDYETAEAVRDEILGAAASAVDLSARLNNIAAVQPQRAEQPGQSLERVGLVPIYSTDPIVRRAASLQQTTDARPPVAGMSAALAQQLGVADGERVRVRQGSGSAELAVAIDASLPANVLRVAAGHSSTSALGSMFGPISVEKV